MDTLNGFPVVQQSPTPARPPYREGRVVLVDRGGDWEERWITAWHGAGDPGWHHGHYFDDYEGAVEDFNARVKRGY